MKLIKKLTKDKNKENQKKLLDEFFINEEAIPTEKTIPHEMYSHPEGEYVMKADGVYLRYTIRDNKKNSTNSEMTK